MCVLVSAAGPPTKAPAKVVAFATEPPLNLPTWSSKLAAAPRCEAEADSLCVLVSDAGTPTFSDCESLLQRNPFSRP